MAGCCACKHRSEKDGCKFYKFRKSPSKRKKWARCLKLQNSPGQRLVCSCHFPGSDPTKTPMSPHRRSPIKNAAVSSSKARRGLFSSTPNPAASSRDHGYSKARRESFTDSGFADIQMEISCEQSDVTNQCSEHVENVRDGLDKITFSDSMTNSPWKVTPLRGRLSTENENLKAALKASKEKLDKATNDFNQNLMQQSEEFKKKLKEADAVFKVKLQQEQANFELIIKQLEDNLSLKSKELEETCQKFQNREYYLNLKLKESEDGFTLKSKELEETCQKFQNREYYLNLKLKESEDGFTLKSKELEENYQKFKNVECDLNSKLKQVENELRVMQKSRDTIKMQLHSLSSESEELRKKIQLQSKNLEIFTKVSNALKNEKQEYKKKLQSSEERLLFKNFITEDNIAHYTGLPNIGTFYWLLSIVQQDIQYYFGSAVKCLTNEDQLFITLFKLRRNVSHQLLSDLFEVSLFTVSNILITWISVLHIIVVEGIMEKNVPSLHKVRHSMPEAFSMYPNCRMIFDCTEVEVQVPSLMSNHNEVYSSYKSRTTFKALIVIAPNGTIIYVSDLFPGSTSDKVLVYNCGVLDLLKAGDAVMADKGFPIGDLLPPGVDLNSLRSRRHHSSQEAR